MEKFLKIIYFLPFVIGCLFYTFIGIVGSFSAINPFVLIVLLLLFISGLLMNRNKWWGCILGIIVGLLLIYMGNQETGQIIKETPFGIVIFIYYIICGVVSKKYEGK